MNPMIYLQLFVSFVKIGFSGVGAYSMIPIVSQEMLTHGWMNTKEISDIIAIAEITPGPFGLNCATYAGMHTAGVLGAIAANIGILMPSFSLCLIVAFFFDKFKESEIISCALIGLRPACIGLILGVAFSLLQTNYFSESGFDKTLIFIGIGAFILLLKFKISVPKVLLLSGIASLIINYLVPQIS